jgi:hypothetical protein
MNVLKAAFHATGRLTQNISSMMRENVATSPVKQPALFDLMFGHPFQMCLVL